MPGSFVDRLKPSLFFSILIPIPTETVPGLSADTVLILKFSSPLGLLYLEKDFC